MVKESVFCLFLAILAFCISGCDTKSSRQSERSVSKTTIRDIKDRDILVVGVKGDTYKFGFRDPNTGIVDGLDVDIAKALAKKILGNSKKLKLVIVTPSSRGTALESNEVDYVIATFTITEDRKKLYNFSDPYYVDSGVGMMVKKNSAIRSFKDLNGKKIGVNIGSTAVKDIQKAAADKKIKIQLVEFSTYPLIKTALDSGQVDCFSTNEVILAQFLTSNEIILSERFSLQSYGIASKKGNNELTRAANELINELQSTGDMQHMNAKWGL